MLRTSDVRRVDFGYFIRPGDETPTGVARVEPCLGYVVLHPDGVLLFDTGIGEGDTEVDAHYRPHRRPLDDALADVGIAGEDVRLVVNCHLHVDHCGGNPRFAGRPIVAQVGELDAARGPDYTIPTLVDFEGARYETVGGETEILPNVLVIPTPGHTDGHQSLAIQCRDGTVILAGQATAMAADYGADQLAWRASREGIEAVPDRSPWFDRLQELDPKRVLFAHDQSVWEPV